MFPILSEKRLAKIIVTVERSLGKTVIDSTAIGIDTDSSIARSFIVTLPMALQTPPPPSISPRQMNLLRIVASMAWSDGELALEEVDVMLDGFGGIFAKNEEQRHELQRELRDYLMQNIPLEELVPKLQSDAERKLVLKLGYEVIASSARTPEEPNINEEEAIAYQKLIDLLGLPPEVVEEIESAVTVPESHQGLIDELVKELDRFVKS